MKRFPWPTLSLCGLLIVTAGQCLSLGSSLEIERARSSAYLHRIRAMTPCDEAVKESRILYQRQLQLHRDSLDTAQNTKGYKTNEHEYVAGLY